MVDICELHCTCVMEHVHLTLFVPRVFGTLVQAVEDTAPAVSCGQLFT